MRIYRFFITILVVLQTLPVQGQAVFEQFYDVPLTIGQSGETKNWLGGLNAAQYGKVDLNGDGKEEWVIYDRSADHYLIYSHENDSLIYQPDLTSFLPEIKPGWVIFVDYNLDGLKDIFSNGDRGVVVYKNVSVPNGFARWKLVADPLLTAGFSGKFNLIANAADIPGIADIDGDGDLDIIVYNFAIGGYIRYNRNLSMDLFGHADSLEYEIKTREWGLFEECDCNLFAFYPETCADLSSGRVMHPGGKALLLIDLDGDQDKDLLAGHEQCEELYLFENYGTTDSAFMIDYSGFFPDPIHPANFHIFPAGFYEDFNFDGTKDLLVAPNVDFNIEYKIDFRHSNLLYINRGTDNLPDFEFISSDFLQNGMLDLGENAVPYILDIDGDGDLDLFVASNGIWTGSDFSGYVSLFENAGDARAPSFTLVEEDFLQLSTLDLKDPKISFADMNGDEAEDLIYTGINMAELKVNSYLFYNQESPNQPPRFAFEERRMISLPTFFGLNDNPLFFDVNEDGLADLLVGRQDGALEYYINEGSADSENFTLENGSFLGIGRDFTLERIFLNASVGDIDQNQRADIITTDYRGIAQIFFDFQYHLDNPAGIEIVHRNETTQVTERVDFDTRSWLAIGDLFGEGVSSIIAGGIRGGLQFFQSEDGGMNPGENEHFVELELYPNPVGDDHLLTIKSNQNVWIEIINPLGQQVREAFEVRKFLNHEIDLQHLASGIYIVRAVGSDGRANSKRIVVYR